jgi:hypothetical protein
MLFALTSLAISRFQTLISTVSNEPTLIRARERKMKSQHAATVITQKSALMQQIQSYVTVGYRYYTSGTVSPERAQPWARKASRLYDAFIDRNRRARAKRRGEGCAVLLLHEANGAGQLWWILLVTANEHAAHQLESLKDAWEQSSRVTLTGYELCHVTKPGASKPVLTWRMTRENYESWRYRIIDTLRRGDNFAIQALVSSLHASPGFHGIRTQVHACRRLLRATWKRLRPSAPPLRLPARVYYLRRRVVLREPLAAWLTRLTERPQVATTLSQEGNQSAETDRPL